MKQSNTILPSKEEVDKVMEWVSKQKNKDEFYLTPNTTIVNCKGNVRIADEDIVDGKLPAKFGKVEGYFCCIGCDNITSLEGSPEEVGDYFYCISCPNLTSLEGSPKKVGGSFYCGGCHNLSTLVGSPEEVGGDFCCSYCPNLTSLEGCTEKIGGHFICTNCDKLNTTTLNIIVK